jgi:hypothetical protein
MALPAGITTVQVRGSYLGFADDPVLGRVVFRPLVERLTDSVEKVAVIAQPQYAALVDGAFEIDLPATDVAEEFLYQVTEEIPDGTSFFIQVPVADAGAGIDLVDAERVLLA